MAAINRVVLVGNLTRDPELRHTPSGTAVCNLRLAVNTRRKDETGQWVDKPNYFDVTVWGNQGERCAQYLAKGRPVAVDGRLEWREWETPEGNKRQAVDIVADTVQFLGGRGDGEGGGGGYIPAERPRRPPATSPCPRPTTTSRFEMGDRQLGHVRMTAVTRRIAARSSATRTFQVRAAADRTTLLGHERPRTHPNHRSTI